MDIIRGGDIGLEQFRWREVLAVRLDLSVLSANDDADLVFAPTAIPVLIGRPGGRRRPARPIRQMGPIARAIARDDQERRPIGRGGLSGLQGRLWPEEFRLQFFAFSLQEAANGSGAHGVAKDTSALPRSAIVVLRHRFQCMLGHARREFVRANIKTCVEGEKSPSSTRGSRGTRA